MITKRSLILFLVTAVTLVTLVGCFFGNGIEYSDGGITDGGFEGDALGLWHSEATEGSVTLDNSDSYKGKQSLKIGAEGAYTATVSQHIKGLRPGYYYLEAYVKNAGDQDFCYVYGKGGECAAEKAGLSTKDVITSINGKIVNTVSEVIDCIEGCGGNKVNLEVIRDGEMKTISFLPEKDESGIYRAGIWVRDSTAGLGTVTLVNAKTGEFWGLGHGICDSDTGVLMPLLRGSVYDISVVSVRKGKAGAPGELKGYFSSSLSGILMKNTAAGVYGRFSEWDSSACIPMPLASRQEVKEGDATIYCTLTNGKVTEYSIRIVKITSPKGDAKNFIIEVTDSRLLEETGGIVQGMSGSTIIQNGKIVGAVTHVMVNDPTRGYGIFIENMLKATA